MKSFANEHVFLYVCRKTQQAVGDLMHSLADLPQSNKSLPVCSVSSLVEEVGHAHMAPVSHFCWRLLSFTGLAICCMALGSFSFYMQMANIG